MSEPEGPNTGLSYVKEILGFPVTGAATDMEVGFVYDSRVRALRRLLREERLRKSYSQKSVAHYACIHERKVGEFERGECEATLELVWRISFALGLNFDSVMRVMNVESFWPRGNRDVENSDEKGRPR